MRRDLLITAILFTAIGFAGGYIYSEQSAGAGRLQPAVARPSPAETGSEALPAGHPPLDIAQQWRTLEEKARSSPNDPQAALELANFLFDHERWESALPWYQRALELQPNNANARTDLATCFFHLSRFEEALAHYEQALKQEPNKPQALYGLALARLHGKQDRVGARQAYEQLRRAHPDFPGVVLLERALEPEGSRP